MPGQPLAVDHDEVRLVALQIGVREAARQFGLEEDTVKKWSSREGWLRKAADEEEKAEGWKMKLREQQGLSPIVPTAAEILRKYSGNTRLKLASVVDKQANCLDEKDPDELLLMAQTVKTVVDSACKLHDIGGQSVSVRLDVIAQCGDTGPVIDV